MVTWFTGEVSYLLNSFYSYLDYKNLEENSEYHTGDIILFKGHSVFSQIIEKCSKSDYSHVGIILVNPTYIDPKLKGIYFIESGFDYSPDSEDGKMKLGVMIHPLDHVIERCKKDKVKMFIRKIQCNKDEFKKIEPRICDIYSSCKNIPYNLNIKDWFNALESTSYNNVEQFIDEKKIPLDQVQKVNAFWCSAFVGYFYCKLGILIKETPWTLLAPKSFDPESADLCFNIGFSLSDIKELN